MTSSSYFSSSSIEYTLTIFLISSVVSFPWSIGSHFLLRDGSRNAWTTCAKRWSKLRSTGSVDKFMRD